MKVIILTKPKFFSWFNNEKLNINLIDNLSSLQPSKKDILISCNTNLIIPKNIFSNYKIALNIHPALYTFPGRDPHHWACYKKAKLYGATAHIISEEVDQGKIIDYEKATVKEFTLSNYREIGNKCTKILLQRLYKKILNKTITNKALIDIHWSKKVSRRKDLLKMCNFKNISLQEIKLRKFAFAGFEKYFKYN
tara:strand:- start:448 stop:1029 length:582 start_codon:yes stop_codon:yes gene_type:complete